jgi:flagellar hook-basal body complex protein FliE
MINKINGLPTPITPKSDQSPIKSKEGQSDFLSTLNDFMGDVNQLQQESGESVKSLASGDITNIHDVMVAVEKASVSFELMMEIRNKVIEAYREVMRTQI